MYKLVIDFTDSITRLKFTFYVDFVTAQAKTTE